MTYKAEVQLSGGIKVPVPVTAEEFMDEYKANHPDSFIEYDVEGRRIYVFRRHVAAVYDYTHVAREAVAA